MAVHSLRGRLQSCVIVLLVIIMIIMIILVFLFMMRVAQFPDPAAPLTAAPTANAEGAQLQIAGSVNVKGWRVVGKSEERFTTRTVSVLSASLKLICKSVRVVRLVALRVHGMSNGGSSSNSRSRMGTAIEVHASHVCSFRHKRYFPGKS